MRFSAAFLDELRGRVTLSTLIGRAVKIARAGREYKACCPFHDEKTPSFTINDEKGFYHCFGCGAHGDAIRWLTDHDSLTFVDAVEQLCGEAGVEVPRASPEAARHAEMIAGQRPTLEAAERIFRGELAKYPVPRHELTCRGIDAAAIEEFGIGFAPEDGALRDQGFNRSDLMAVGLIGRSEVKDGRGGFVYVRFKSRIMVPIHDHRGRIVGFGGRDVPQAHGAAPSAKSKAKDRPKYVNSPDSPIFDKGRLLFNLHRARELFRASRRLLLLEGYFDVVALHRLGLAAVAPMGTALTVDQLERAWQIDNCPLLLFDGDAAGMKAAVRAAETALPHLGPGKSLTIGALPQGQDPDDLVRSSIAAGEDPAQALAAWLTLNPPQAVREILFDHAVAGADGDGPEHWAGVWARLAEWGEAIANEATRAGTLMYWRRRWEVDGSLAPDNVKEVDDDSWQAELVRLGFEDATTIDGGDERVQAMVEWLVGEFDAIAEIQQDISERMAFAKIAGFDPAMLRKVARLVIARRKDPEKAMDKEAREAAYRRAIGMQGPMTEAMLPPPFVAATRAGGSKTRAMLPPPTRRIEAMMNVIEGRG